MEGCKALPMLNSLTLHPRNNNLNMESYKCLEDNLKEFDNLVSLDLDLSLN